MKPLSVLWFRPIMYDCVPAYLGHISGDTGLCIFLTA
jgi:hypothetical protein